MEKISLKTETKKQVGKVFYQVYKSVSIPGEFVWALITDGNKSFTRSWKIADYNNNIEKLEADVSYYVNSCIKKLR